MTDRDRSADHRTRSLLALETPLHASLSPDGTRLSVTTVRVPEGTETEILEVTVTELATGRSRPLPGSLTNAHLAEWSPDGQSLALLAEHDGATVLGRLDLATARWTALQGAAHVDAAPVWSPDGSSIVIPCRRGVQLDRSRPFRWTRPFLAADGIGPLEDPPQLRLVDVATGEGRWLTDDEWRWAMPRWSPAGDRVAAVVGADPTDRLGGQCLRVVHLDGTVEVPDVPGGRAVIPAWLSDGRLVAVVAEPHGRPGGSSATLFVVEPGRVREVAVEGLLGDVYGDCAAELADVYEHVLLPRGPRSVVVRTGRRGRQGIMLLDVDSGEPTSIIDGDRACSPVGLANNTLVFTRQSPDVFPEIAAVDLTESASAEALVRRFSDGTEPAVSVHRFAVPAPDGGELDAWFLSGRETAAPMPTVLVIHGGPHFTYGEAFSLDAQALCAAGFGVLYTNPRGSTGYGDDFAHAVHGDWPYGPSEDVLAVLDAAIDRGLADADRLGVTGNSYGGYLSAWLVSTTDRFAAAVIENPVTDLIGMYGTSDIGRRFFPAQLGGPPHALPDVYVQQSPVLHAHNCTTPCLFVTGDQDRRCPPGQTWAMHRILCEVGTPSEVLVLPGSTHEGSTYGPIMGRLAHDAALVEWMSRWLSADLPERTKEAGATNRDTPPVPR